MLSADKSILRRPLHQLQERIVVAFNVQERTGLLLQAQLRPGERLAELIPGTKAAGKCQEAIGQIGHECLALVHCSDYVHFGQGGMSDLFLGQRAGDHADYAPAARQAGIRQGSHESNVAAAVNQRNASLSQQLTQMVRGFAIGRTPSMICSTEHTKGMDHCSIVRAPSLARNSQSVIRTRKSAARLVETRAGCYIHRFAGAMPNSLRSEEHAACPWSRIDFCSDS